MGGMTQVIRVHLYQPIRNLAWNWQLRHFPSTLDGKRLLHIGCGEIHSPEFINLDARPMPHVHIVSKNIFRLSMIADSSLDMIYMSHVLEHVPRNKVLEVIHEMARVLKPDGILRISVPDFDHIIAIYEASGQQINAIAPALMGGQNYEFNFHYGVFNKEYLSSLLSKGGFLRVRPWDPTNCDHHDFDDWASKFIYLDDRPFPISLNLEGNKAS